MIYTKTVQSSFGGDADNPTKVDMPVTAGLIYRFELYLPPGPSGLLHVWMTDGGYQVWPSEPGEHFFGDNITIGFDDKYWINSPDHLLSIWHYNLSPKFNHVFQIRIGQVSEEQFINSLLPSMGSAQIADQIAALNQAQQPSVSEERLSAIRSLLSGAK